MKPRCPYEHILNAGIYVGLSIVPFFRLLRGPKSTCDSVEYHHRIRLFMSRVPRSKLATYEGRKTCATLPCLASRRVAITFFARLVLSVPRRIQFQRQAKYEVREQRKRSRILYETPPFVDSWSLCDFDNSPWHECIWEW